MNEPITIQEIFPGAATELPQENAFGFPKAPFNLTLGFNLETHKTPIKHLMPSKKAPDGVMTTRNFKQILSSIKEIGLIEPLSVIPTDDQNETFLLLDGNLRVLALKELVEDQTSCLIAKDFEIYTYNHRINRRSAVQEHYMLRRAIDIGISKERLARAFNVNLSTINSRVNLLLVYARKQLSCNKINSSIHRSRGSCTNEICTPSGDCRVNDRWR